MLLYVITYDIPCDRRRKQIADILEGYGERVQYSVFECFLNHNKYEELRKKLKKIFNSKEDSIRFYPISKHTLSQVVIMGEPPLSAIPGSVIV